MSRSLDPQTRPDKAFGGSKHFLTRYLEDFGRLGCTSLLKRVEVEVSDRTGQFPIPYIHSNGKNSIDVDKSCSFFGTGVSMKVSN